MMIRHRIQLMETEKFHKKYLNLIFFLELSWKKRTIAKHHIIHY
jgi:hypothetical protein